MISANVEGLTAVKASLLSGMCKVEHCHCLCLKETHRDSVHARQNVPGMTLKAKRPHKKYVNAIFVRDNLKVKSVSIRDEGNVEFITVELLTKRLVLHALGHSNLPCIVIGDFNSHITVAAVTLRQSITEKRWTIGQKPIT